MKKAVSVVKGRWLTDRCEGISSYKNVIVLWDEDFDTRVLVFVDSLTESIRKKLLLVSETEGNLNLVWRKGIPKKLLSGASVEVEFPKGEFDSWTIESFIADKEVL